MKDNPDKNITNDRHINLYFDYLRFEKLLSANTIESYSRDIHIYNQFLDSKKIGIFSVTYNDILDFLETLYVRFNESTISRILSALRSFYKFLLREGLIKSSPFSNIKNPKAQRKIVNLLEEEEIIKILESIPYSSMLELRDRAMFELLYSCGIRVGEIITLKLNDIDYEQKVIRFTGKGNKERIVPVGESAIDYIKKYIFASRNKLKKKIKTEKIFLNKSGSGISRQGVWKIIKKYSKLLGLDKNIYPHIFRHSYATHMIERGADLRVVQELLGHSSVSTTEVYTNLSKSHIKKTYFKFHPRNKKPSSPQTKSHLS
jgi:integrase/recombinase XerD